MRISGLSDDEYKEIVKGIEAHRANDRVISAAYVETYVNPHRTGTIQHDQWLVGWMLHKNGWEIEW